MDEISGRTAMPSSSPPPPRPLHRPGRRVGSLFQRLLPKSLHHSPERDAKRASKKSSEDDKMAADMKSLQVADQCHMERQKIQRQSEAKDIHFPRSAAKDSGISDPGLVARLMGLEMMPALTHDTPRTASVDSESSGHISNSFSCHSNHLENGIRGKPEKMGHFKGTAGWPLCSELQYGQSLPSHGRKEHKKLIKLANKGSEQSCLSYRNGGEHGNADQTGAMIWKKFDEPVDALQRPCVNCGRLVNIADIEINMKQTSVVEYGYPSHKDLLANKQTPKVCQSSERILCPASHAKASRQNVLPDLSKRKLHSQKYDELCVPVNVMSAKSAYRLRSLLQNRLPLVQDSEFRVWQQNMIDQNTNGSNGFTSFCANVNSDNLAEAKSSALISTKTDMKRDKYSRSVNAVRANMPNSAVVRTDMVPAKDGKLLGRHIIKQNFVGRDTRDQCSGYTTSSNEPNEWAMISNISDAPLLPDLPSLHSDMIRRNEMNKSEYSHMNTPPQEMSARDFNSDVLSPQNVLHCRGDQIDALLERKIRELNSLSQDDFDADYGLLKGSSTASILEELITALTDTWPLSQTSRNRPKDGLCENSVKSYNSPDKSDCAHHQEHILQGDLKWYCSASSAEVDSCQPSPVSVLEASFSAFSAGSPSSESYNGCTPHNCSKRTLRSKYFDAHRNCSTTNKIKENKLPAALDIISLMYDAKLARNSLEIRFLESKAAYAREIISNMELHFLSSLYCDSDITTEEFPINYFLFQTLEGLVVSCCISFTICFRFESAKDESWSRKFLFDCLVEHLDLKYSESCNSGYAEWSKLPARLSVEELQKDVSTGFCRWSNCAEKALDEIIEMELSYVVGKWDDFTSEGYGAGREFEQSILEELIDEAVVDLSLCYN